MSVEVTKTKGAESASAARTTPGQRSNSIGLTGALVGIVCAVGAGRLMDAVLFGISPTDGLSFVRALALVLLSITAASLVPAARAARTSPLSALRHQ